jgi:membrane-associated phospholipid phosphatase
MTNNYLIGKGQHGLTNSRQSAVWNSVRATPVLIPVAGVIMMLLSPSVMAGGFTIGALATTPINALLKMFFKWLHFQINGNFTGTTIFGQGPRPTGAKGSGCFLNFPLKQATSWGMPSGHSQLSWYVVGFLIGYIFIWRPHAFTVAHKIGATVFVVLAALVVSFSRVWVEGVHTPAQVFIGGLLGFIIGLITLALTRHFAKIYLPAKKLI